MKTSVEMKRPLFGIEISQKSGNEFFSATDLVKAGNKWRISNGLEPFKLANWLQTKGTKEFIAELQERYGKVKINSKGKGHHTWVHPLLFIDIALAISPKLKIETYEWLFDSLIKNRNLSGNSYKLMAGALYAHSRNKSAFYSDIRRFAGMIKLKIGAQDWQRATEKQLRLRDKAHESIALLAEVLRDNEQAVRIALDKLNTN